MGHQSYLEAPYDAQERAIAALEWREEEIKRHRPQMARDLAAMIEGALAANDIEPVDGFTDEAYAESEALEKAALVYLKAVPGEREDEIAVKLGYLPPLEA